MIDIFGKGVLDTLSRSGEGQRISMSVGLHKVDVSAFVGLHRSDMGEYCCWLEDVDIGWHLDHRQYLGEFYCVTVQGRLVPYT